MNSVDNIAQPIELTADLPRIFAQNAYAHVRTMALVPIVNLEAYAIAAFYPIIWKRQDDHFDLMALRSIGIREPLRQEASLPLILRAYPLHLPEDGADTFAPRLYPVHADNPSDVGSPIFLANGKLSLGAQQRLRCLAIYRQGILDTQQLGWALNEMGFFTPWDLRERVGAPAQVPEDLYVIKDPEALRELPRFLDRFGQKGLGLIAAHRLSMFCTKNLLDRSLVADK